MHLPLYRLLLFVSYLLAVLSNVSTPHDSLNFLFANTSKFHVICQQNFRGFGVRLAS